MKPNKIHNLEIIASILTVMLAGVSLYAFTLYLSILNQKADLDYLQAFTHNIELRGKTHWENLYKLQHKQLSFKDNNEIIDIVFADKADEAKKIVKCESGFNPKAMNVNRNGSKDIGLFQINSVHGVSPRFLENPLLNTLIAKEIYDGRGGWSAWTCSRKVL